MVFQIKKGLQESLNILEASNSLIEGCWYLTTDTQKLYVCVNKGLVCINETESFDPTEINQKISTLESKVDIIDERLTDVEEISIISGGSSAEFST